SPTKGRRARQELGDQRSCSPFIRLPDIGARSNLAMKPSTFLPFVCASLLLACGQDDVTTAQAEAESELNSLQDRVAAITGRAYTAPAEAAVPAQYVQDQQVAGPGISNAGP